MKKRLRLRKNSDFQRVRRKGHSWTHPLLVLCALHNNLGYSRVGFSASKWIGGAVVRNRAKRLMREATRLRLTMIADGWDVVMIARQPMREANFHQVDQAVEQLLRRARLLKATKNLKSFKPDDNPPLDGSTELAEVSSSGGTGAFRIGF
jgi:ribonuclease P protein component